MLTHSYTFLLGRAASLVLLASWASSLLGRAVDWALAFLGRLARGSLLLSLDSVRSRPLEDAGEGMVTGLVSRTYRATRHLTEKSLAGRWSRAALAAVPAAAVVMRWIRPAGAALLGVSAGRLVRLAEGGGSPFEVGVALALWGSVLLAGAFMLLRGPRAAQTWNDSRARRAGGVLWRALSGEEVSSEPRAPARFGLVEKTGTAARDSGGRQAFIAATALLAGAAAFLAGVAPGRSGLIVVALAAGAFLAGLAAYRPQVLLVLVAAFPWVDWAARRSLGGLGAAWDELLLLGALVLLAFGALFTGQVRLRTVPLTLPLLVALAAAVVSQTVTGVPNDVSLFALRVTFQPLVFFYLGYLLPGDKRWVRLAITVFLGTSLLLALHGIQQYLTDAPMPAAWLDQRETTIGTRAYSIILNPNGLGAFLLLAALVSLSLALAPLARLHRLTMVLLTAVLVAGIAVTFSRGAWIALVLGGFALAALAYRRLFAGLVVAALVAPFIAPRPFLDRIAFALSERYIAQSLRAGRLLMWDVSLRRIVADPLFGSGLGTFGGTVAVTYGFHRLWVDNFYVQLAAEGGLILFVAYMWLLLRAGKGLVAATLSQADPYLRAVSAGVFAGFVAVLLANFTASVWETLAVGAGFWFLAGLASRPAEQGPPLAEESV